MLRSHKNGIEKDEIEGACLRTSEYLAYPAVSGIKKDKHQG